MGGPLPPFIESRRMHAMAAKDMQDLATIDSRGAKAIIADSV